MKGIHNTHQKIFSAGQENQQSLLGPFTLSTVYHFPWGAGEDTRQALTGFDKEQMKIAQLKTDPCLYTVQ